MMKLYIVGAGNVGGYIAYHAEEMGEYKLCGFLDDDETKLGNEIYHLPVIGNVGYLLNTTKEVAVVIAIANSVVKKFIVNKLSQNKLIRFPAFIHPSVWIGKNVKVGDGAIIYPGVTINYEAFIGNFVTINMNSTIGHNCNLMDYSTLSPGVDCGGFTQLGEQSFLGIGSSTLQSVKIGQNTIIGGGAMVIDDIPDNVIAAGVPAKVIKYH